MHTAQPVHHNIICALDLIAVHPHIYQATRGQSTQNFAHWDPPMIPPSTL